MTIGHIAAIDADGWSISHPIWCDDILQCTLTRAFKAYTSPPEEGRFWAAVSEVRDRYVVELGAAVPMEITGTSKRTAARFASAGQRPGHPAFGTGRERLVG
jgi:hypothetical protein